jgi:hypothetical protein
VLLCNVIDSLEFAADGSFGEAFLALALFLCCVCPTATRSYNACLVTVLRASLPVPIRASSFAARLIMPNVASCLQCAWLWRRSRPAWAMLPCSPCSTSSECFPIRFGALLLVPSLALAWGLCWTLHACAFPCLRAGRVTARL